MFESFLNSIRELDFFQKVSLYGTIFSIVGASTIYYLFGVRKVSDKLSLTFKKDSVLLLKVLKETNLETMEFKTCLAGTISTVQMLTMLIVEYVYHTFYQQVKFHREIFKFKDGGQAAMDWAFEMPLKTKYFSKYEKEKIEAKKGFFNEVSRPILVIFPGMCSDETEIYIHNTAR